MKRAVLVCGLFGLLGALVAGCDGNKCEAASNAIETKYEECGIQGAAGDGSGATVQCTELLGKQSECAAKCTTDATCEALEGDEGAAEYAACVADCVDPA